MLRNLIIINAGNFGREVYSWARQSTDHGVVWRLKGFLDSRKDILRGYRSDIDILAAPEDYEPLPDDLFICAVGNPVIAKKYCEIIVNHGGTFTNVIHPSVVFGDNVNLGTGVVLCPNVVMSCDTKIGNFVGVNINASIGHDVVIGDFCQISPNVSLAGRVVLKEAVSVGSNAVILPNVVVEDLAIVGAGSVVLKGVKERQTVFGVPARPLPPSDS